ncbi:hypothetical protein DPMN_167082 [Dreissena polymorpha]|uniref:Uncharacterized protein n=1 Tax=Dreissena polymorpha TaxID=45954 RepID=A0A9D4EZR1_DREPO|nr:hypothetical protein DPMN_167082 [Dreissena polymorpha]
MNNKWPLGGHLSQFYCMSKFQQDWEKMCLLDCPHKTAPLPGCHVFSLTTTIFKLVRDIHITNVLTKFHDDKAKHVTYRVFTSFFTIQHEYPFSHRFQGSSANSVGGDGGEWRKNAPPLGSHVFQAKVTFFKLIQDIIGTNHLSKFHEDRKINVASRVKCPAPWRPYIIGMNLLTKFYEDRTVNVASRVKNAPPLGSHVFQAN